MVDIDSQNSIGVIGATSFVGASLLPLLTKAGCQVLAFSRQLVAGTDDGVVWRQLPLTKSSLHQTFPPRVEDVAERWVCVAPIWVLQEYFTLMETYGVRRVVVLSSTSRFTKDKSTDSEEQALALRFAEGEMRVQAWAESHGVEWVILRPTLIYGLGRDKNIAEIARLICRFGFFPLLGKASGLRQPIHTEAVAGACMAALQTPCATDHAYNISGGETLTYRDMVVRIFTALGRRPRLLTVPLWVFRLAVAMLRHLPRYRLWSAAMVERMNRDLVFDHSDATRDLDFLPQPFQLTPEDLPN